MKETSFKEGIPLNGRYSGGSSSPRLPAYLTAGLLVLAAVLLPALFPSPSPAGHEMGNQCYTCHNIRSGQVWQGSYSVYSGTPIGMSSYGRPITCDVCHTDYVPKFNNTQRSNHPVRIISGASTVADNTFGKLFGTSPAFIDCRDCHYGNTTVLAPDLNPDVSPSSYFLGVAGNTGTDGYPNHDNTISGFTLVSASWDNQNVVTPGTAPHLGLLYNKSPSSAPATDYALCFSCHDGVAGKTNRQRNVLSEYTTGAGHYYKSGAPTGGAVNDKMPCSDCHYSHGSGNSRLFRSPKGTTGGLLAFSNAASPTGPEVRAMCNECHADYGAPGSFTGATPFVRGIRPLVRPNTVAEHATANTTSCVAAGCHNAHDAPAQCNLCHGYAGDGSGMPPSSPTSGARVWSASVDRAGNRAGQGMHRVNAADNVMRTDHDAYSCTECHTSTPGSGGTHNDGGLNATMDNLVSRRWTDLTTPTTWTPRTDGATASVVDDSCNNVNCHSPFGPYQATQPSGTPFRYERYWENYTLWDCYTCHGYKDSDAVTDNTNNPGNLDRHIDTGAHDRHTRTLAKGGLNYDCGLCHATGNATLYSVGAPAGDNTYPGTHKTGFVEWTFAGAMNPFGVAAASRTYSGSQLGGAGFVPTDNGSAHRRYGSCANLYCHSIGQHPTTGAALTANDNTHYRPPRWDNTFGGKCGDCHGGNGATDNAASIMTTGSHRQHDNTAPYAYACAICHNGLGRGTAKHVDNQVSLGFGAALPSGGTIVTATYSQGLDNAAGNGYGNCTATYCHGTDGNPALRLSGGANQATGTTNRPTWGDNTTGNCGSCHGAPGATTNYNPGTYVGTQDWPTQGFHARHVSDNVVGPNPVLACTDCHTASNVSTHVNGRVDFRTAWDCAAVTDKAGTQVCNPCHGSGVAEVKANWDNVAYVSNCLGCHGSTAAYTYDNGTGRMAPTVDNGAYGANTTGHNRSSGSYLFSNNPAANNPAGKTACTVCHRATLQHINNVNDNSYAGNRLSDNVNAVTGLTTISGMCAACHTNTGSSTATNNKVNTHGNTGFTGANHDNGAQNFAYNCDACHEPHGMTRNDRSAGTYNIFMVRASVEVRNFSTGVDITADNTTTTGPVWFESTTGNYSYDDNTSANASRLCVTCHLSTSRPGNSTPLSVAGGGGSHSGTPGGDYTTDERRNDCASCHNHNKDDNTATVDGLMPQACNGCHSYPGLDNATSPRQMSVGHRDHVGVPGAGGTANSRGFLCATCHSGYLHNQSGYAAGQAWSVPAYYANVNVRFDNTWNPDSPTYAGAPAGTATAPGVGGTGVCAGLYCHGGNATRNAGWSGSATAPRWDNVGGAPCGACHDTGTSDTTPSTRQRTGNHPAHVDNAWGPGIGAFSAGGNCAEGAGCHTAYGLTLTSSHVNNQVSFRTGVADNTAVNLGSTGICVNCHGTTASSQGTGDTLARTQSNWDNGAYRLPCVTCHNNGTQAWQNLDGTGGRAPNIDVAYYGTGNGHGAPSIDNGSTGTDSGLTDQTVPVRCNTCHDETSLHIGTAKDGTNPWRFASATNYTSTGGLDQFCLGQCHTGTPSTHPARHAWRVSGSGVAPAQAKDNAVHTHPTSQVLIPAGKDRWLQLPSGTEIPVQDNLTTKSAGARTGNSLLVCVSCHDPHGVGTATTATRSFSGANTEASKQMLRYDYSGVGGGTTALCAKCHK